MSATLPAPGLHTAAAGVSFLRPLGEAVGTFLHWPRVNRRPVPHVVRRCRGCATGALYEAVYVPALLYLEQVFGERHRWQPVLWYLPEPLRAAAALAGSLCGFVFQVEGDRARRVQADALGATAEALPFDARPHLARMLRTSAERMEWFQPRLGPAATVARKEVA